MRSTARTRGSARWRPQSAAQPRRTDVNAPALPPAQSKQAYQAHLAAVEFALSNAIIIRDRDDIQSARHWSELLEPFEHQVQNLITFCRRTPAALIADDVGLGKTISAGLILSELMTRGRVTNALIVAPKILLPQWRSELKSKFRIPARDATGSGVLDALRANESVIITTYHAARDHMSALQEHGFDLAIFDEAHKLKSLHGTSRPARWAKVIRKALGNSSFRYALFLTATPIQNSPWDLYSLIDCVAATGRHDNPFGPTDAFQRNYLTRQTRRFATPTLAPAAKDRFREVVSRYTMRLSRGTSRLPFPNRVVALEKARPTSVEQRLLDILVTDLQHLNRLEQISLAIAMMSSPAAFAHQLTRRAGNNPDLEASAAVAREAARKRPIGAKGVALKRLLEQLRDSSGESFRCVVFTVRRETQQALATMLEALGMRVGLIRGGRARENQATIDAFNADPPTVNVIISTDAGAEGVNLQVANVLVNYDLPWNPMVVEQRIGRVQRLGSRFAQVIVYNLVIANSIEEQVVTRLLTKLQTITDALGDIEGIIEAAGSSTNDYDLETRIQDLVLAALRGQDTAEAAKRIEEEIERAKQLYERERAKVDETLGSDLDAIHRAGPAPPDIEPVTPRMDIRTFVRTAHQADGATVHELDDRRLQVHYPGQSPFIATFDPHDPDLRATTQFGGVNAQLYIEGSRPFEQLVGNWAARRVHITRDHRTSANTSPTASTKAWLEQFGSNVAFEGLRITNRHSGFHGTITVKATASTRHDRIERLIDIPIGDTPPTPDPEDTDLYTEALTTTTVDTDLPAVIDEAVSTSDDIQRFSTYYLQRRDEESSKVTSAEVKRIVAQDFTPTYAGDLQAATGVITDTVQAEASFTIDEHGPYTANLTIAAGVIETAPDTATCAITGRSYPTTALATCEISTLNALRHLLITSDHSGRRALPEHTARCAITGATLLSDETLTSAVSGTTANRDLFKHCAITNQPALDTELATCAFTHTAVLPQHITTSDISGKPARSDQIVASAVSGTRGHRSELLTCHETHAHILPSEAGTSNVSGVTVRADLLLTSQKNPKRRGTKRETITCSLSGRRLLSDETERSDVSGQHADRDLMAHSDTSGRPALPSELVQCERSGRRLLPDETGVCVETGQRVHTDLLTLNDLTGQQMLTELLRVCPETGKRGRPRDLTTCAATGYLVDPSITTTCSQTNQTVLERLTIDCAECRRPLLRTQATHTHLDQPAHPTCTQRCTWTGSTALRSTLKTCTATGALFLAEFINPTGTTHMQAALERSIITAAHPDTNALDHLRSAFAQHHIKIHRVWTQHATRNGTLALIAEERAFLGLKRTYHVAFFDTTTNTFIGHAAPTRPR